MSRLLLILLVALGTYLMSFLPLKWQKKWKTFAHLGEFLEYSTAALLAALFVTTFWKLPSQPMELCRRILALAPVLFSFLSWQNLGFSILPGILTHLLLSSLF
ncbi:MAG: AzlD domain-containing protein [Candidatus Caldatribacteriaceae bacterium]